MAAFALKTVYLDKCRLDKYPTTVVRHSLGCPNNENYVVTSNNFFNGNVWKTPSSSQSHSRSFVRKFSGSSTQNREFRDSLSQNQEQWNTKTEEKYPWFSWLKKLLAL